MHFTLPGVAGATLSSLLGNDDERKECLIRYLLDPSSGGFVIGTHSQTPQNSIRQRPDAAAACSSKGFSCVARRGRRFVCWSDAFEIQPHGRRLERARLSSHMSSEIARPFLCRAWLPK